MADGARLVVAVGRIRGATAGRPLTGVGHQQADGVTGTFATDDAIGFDPLPLLRAFGAAGAAVTVIGQVAGILHGSDEPTGDLDLLWSGAAGDAGPVAAALARLGAVLHDDDGAPVEVTAAALARLPKVVFRTATAAGDLCTPELAWGALDVAAFLRRAEVMQVAGVAVSVVTRDDLVAMRRAAGRPKDHRRADALEPSR